MALVPAEEAKTDLGEEMQKLQALADEPVTPGASAVSPTIYAGTPGPALSGVLANTEGLSAFEQIIKLREVRHNAEPRLGHANPPSTLLHCTGP